MGAGSIARLEPVADAAPRPFWSVVIPTFQRPAMLRECLASVLARDPGPEHLEIIVQEDHGEAMAASVVAEFKGRVRHRRAEHRLGQVANINAGLAATRGTWIHVLHDDDWVAPGFHDIFRRALEGGTRTIGGAICGQVNVRPSGERVALEPVWDKAGALSGLTERLIRANPISPGALVVRREAHETIGLYREDLRFTADWEFLVRLSVADDMVIVPEHLAFYRQHAASVTGSRRWVDQAREIDRLMDEFAAASMITAPALASARANQARNFASRAIARAKEGDGGQALDFAQGALVLDASPAMQEPFLLAAGMRQAAALRAWMFDAMRARVLAETASNEAAKPPDTPLPLAPVEGDGARPFWSVVIPAYGRPAMLRETLRSVLAQDPGPERMEIIVHEDHGEETAGAVVAEFLGRVRHIRAERRLYGYGNMNAALAHTRGLWTHLLHDDDWVAPDFYATFRPALEGQPDRVGAALCGQYNVPARGEPYRLALISETPGVLPGLSERLLRANPISPVALVVRRAVYERIGGYRMDMPFAADWEFLVRMSAACEVFNVPRFLAYYRMHESSITGSTSPIDHAREAAVMIEEFAAKSLVSARDIANARAQQAYNFADAAAQCARQGDDDRTLSLARAALVIDVAPAMHERFLAAAIARSATALRAWMFEAMRAHARRETS